jgi:EAL domain
MTAAAMTFYVKSETADGSLNLIPCFEPRQVFDNPGINAKWGVRHGLRMREGRFDEMTQRWRWRQPVAGARRGIAIDDFGTGYSSLEYLLTFRVGRIKIAQQFVNGLHDDHGSSAIVRATIGLRENLTSRSSPKASRLTPSWNFSCKPSALASKASTSAALCQQLRLRSCCAKVWSRPQPSANWRRDGRPLPNQREQQPDSPYWVSR